MGFPVPPQSPSVAEDELLHELRNGLTGIHGAVLVVRDGLDEGKEREVLTRVISRIERLNIRLRDATRLAPSEQRSVICD
jgi:nitrogen-specific signal transduction histidine kinase